MDVGSVGSSEKSVRFDPKSKSPSKLQIELLDTEIKTGKPLPRGSVRDVVTSTEGCNFTIVK
jgi:hypothetical protein